MGRRKFSPEFKLEAVKLVTEQHRSLSAAAAELGIPASTLSSWVQRSPVDFLVDEFGPIGRNQRSNWTGIDGPIRPEHARLLDPGAAYC